MTLSLSLFLFMLILSGLCFAGGFWLARGRASGSWLTMAVALIVLIAWAYLARQPAVAAKALPMAVLTYLEGIAPVPIFMLILGSAWAHSNLVRQRRLAFAAVIFGGLFFIHGGWWMLQAAPALGDSGPNDHQWIVYQSEDYSCVPAACATALNFIGVPTTEAQMASLTHTRAHTGATLFRAADGLSRRLGDTDISVEVLQPGYEQLQRLPMPVLTPIRVSGVGSYLHMVVIMQVTANGVWIVDPQLGLHYMSRDDFDKAYIGRVIAFDRQRS